MSLLNKIMLLGLLVLQTPLTQALSSDKDQPIDIAADSVDIDDGKGISIYQGKVELQQGSIRLFADEVTIKHRDNKPDTIHAVGKPVRFRQTTDDGETVKARGQTIDYAMNAEYLELTGKAELHQAKDTMRSDRITYDRVKHQVKGGAAAKGKQRVHMTIKPTK